MDPENLGYEALAQSMDGELNVPRQSSHKPKPAKLETVNSTILGAAAEHYVMCQLLRQDMIAALAPAGVPNADIVVTDKLGSKVAAVQVKARRDIGSDGGWHMKKKHETMIEPLLFYCFVDFGKSLADAPKCWVIPSAIVADTLKRSYEAWLKAPGRGGGLIRTTTCAAFSQITAPIRLERMLGGSTSSTKIGFF